MTAMILMLRHPIVRPHHLLPVGLEAGWQRREVLKAGDEQLRASESLTAGLTILAPLRSECAAQPPIGGGQLHRARHGRRCRRGRTAEPFRLHSCMFMLLPDVREHQHVNPDLSPGSWPMSRAPTAVYTSQDDAWSATADISRTLPRRPDLSVPCIEGHMSNVNVRGELLQPRSRPRAVGGLNCAANSSVTSWPCGPGSSNSSRRLPEPDDTCPSSAAPGGAGVSGIGKGVPALRYRVDSRGSQQVRTPTLDGHNEA
jgi:hypothetical protein